MLLRGAAEKTPCRVRRSLRFGVLQDVIVEAGVAICENRSFRARDVAETAAAKALADMTGLEDDGTPIFPEGYTGFDDDVLADAEPE